MTEEATTLYVLAGRLGLEPKVLSDMIELGHAKSPLMQTALTMMQTGEKPPAQCLAEWLLIACTELERVHGLAAEMSAAASAARPMFIPIEDTALGRTRPCAKCGEPRDAAVHNQGHYVSGYHPYTDTGQFCMNCDGNGYLFPPGAPGGGNRVSCKSCDGTGRVVPPPLGRQCPKCLKPIENLAGECPYAKTGTCTSHWFAQQEANRVTMSRANCKACGGAGEVQTRQGPGVLTEPCPECA